MTIHFDDTIHITPVPDGVSKQEFNQEVNRLDGRIDTVEASSDVTDVVGTYSDLQSYDTSALTDNDIIKVLEDSTHDNAISYYRWSTTSETFTYIGSLGPFPTKDYVDNTFSDKSLSNLSSDGNARLHALKSYEDAGELLTDAEGLADVKSYAHSTFDLSKFTVVGTPTITDDGIASGFSNGNYIYGLVSISTDKSLVIKQKVQISDTTSNLGILGVFTGSDYTQTAGNFNFGLDATGAGELYLRYYNGSGTTNKGTGLTITANTEYNIRIEYNGVNELKVYANDTLLTTVSNYSPLGAISFIKPGVFVSYLSAGSIDLKQFSITVDGVPVFSGNKTGIDTIKPCNTVIGNPTISADGIASGFSSSNYIQTPELPSITKNFDLYINISLPSTITTTSNIIIGGASNSYGGIQLGISNTLGDAFISLRSTDAGGLDFDIIKNFTIATLTLGQTYDFHLNWNGTKYIMYYKLANENSWNTVDIVSSTAKLITSGANNRLCIGDAPSYWGGARPFEGLVDLNTVKIYVDGDLVYQPCLKIPYTMSKTGSKIIDSNYRSRVSDMYSQFGYAPYYTLSDTDFTLPMGELYGMIAKTSGNGGSTYTAGSGIDITSDVISVNYDSTKGISATNNAIGVMVDGTTIDFDASGNLTAIGGGGGSITVDQTYDATSTNPQSGTAVAEAIANNIIKVPNLSEKGTLSINNLVLSGNWGSSNYAFKNNLSTYNNINSMEMQFNFNTGTITQNAEYRVVYIGNSSLAYTGAVENGEFVLLYKDKSIIFYQRPTSGDTTNNLYILTDNKLTSNVNYILKIIYDGTDFKFYSSNTTEEDLTIFATEAVMTTDIAQNKTHLSLGAQDGFEAMPSDATINLPKCYIKINNNLMWQGTLDKSLVDIAGEIYLQKNS